MEFKGQACGQDKDNQSMRDDSGKDDGMSCSFLSCGESDKEKCPRARRSLDAGRADRLQITSFGRKPPTFKFNG